MKTFEIDSRYHDLVKENERLLHSLQEGILLDSEAAIAFADLRGRMDCLDQLSTRKEECNGPAPFFYMDI